MNKQRKIVSNHQLTLHIPEQTNHHSEDVLYELSKCYSIKLWWVLKMKLIGGGGRESTNRLGIINLP